MTPPRLLLLLPSTTYRASAFLDAARRIGIALTVGSDHTSTLGRAAPEGLLALDFGDPEHTVAQVRAFAARTPIAAVFGVDDDTALLAAHVAGALDLRHSGVEACRAARDKHRQRVVLGRAGVPVPPFALHRFDEDLDAVARAVAYPCVVKPTRLSMSRGVMRANDGVEFVQAVRRLEAILREPDAARACGEAAAVFLVEAFVPGREVALEGLMQGEALSVLTIFDKPDPLDGPFFEETIYATPSGLSGAEQAAVAACVERAALALGLWTGPVHAEVRLNAHGVWLVELAARPIGGRCSAVLRFGPRGETGLEEVLLRHALDLPIATLEREPGAAAVLMVPVPRAGTLVGVSGVDEARQVPWIDDVVITAHPGQELRPLPEGNRYLGFVFARAASVAEAVGALRAAHTKLSVELA